MGPQTAVSLLFVIALCYVPSVWRRFVHNRKLALIPTTGPSGFLTSYLGALRFLFHGEEMVQEGYEKFRGSIFKVPTFTSWFVVVSSGQLIDEMRRAPDDVLSAVEVFREDFSLDLTIGPQIFDDPFHIEAIKGPLTRNIGARFADVQEEIIAAFDDYIPIKGNEWTNVTAYTTIMDIVCRASNRMLVGLPLCRNPDWIDLNKRFTIDIIKAAILLGLLPAGLRPFVVHILRSIPNGIRRGEKHLEPLIRERLVQEASGKDQSEQPNDIITWMLDVTKDRPRSTDTLLRAVLGVNFAAIHTTTMAFTYVLYELATRPEYMQPLRDEIEAVINEEGWSKNSVGKLQKVDSFIKECMRVANTLSVTMGRKVMKDFTFSNGMTVPAGSTVVAPGSVHKDPNNYTDPETFDGFRFEKMRGNDIENRKYQLVSLGVDYVLFGHGRHACPGRFFAANELKVMLSHVILNYDVKMADGQERPKKWQFGGQGGPDTKAKVLFRKRTKLDIVAEQVEMLKDI